MRSSLKYATGFAAIVMMGGLLPGCYEESPQPVPVAQPTPQPGPITGFQDQGGGPALAPAKRSAENTVRKAEDASQRTADDANREMEPGGD